MHLLATNKYPTLQRITKRHIFPTFCYSAGPTSDSCKAFCYRMTAQAWSDRCRWKGSCEGCPACPTSAWLLHLLRRWYAVLSPFTVSQSVSNQQIVGFLSRNDLVFGSQLRCFNAIIIHWIRARFDSFFWFNRHYMHWMDCMIHALHVHKGINSCSKAISHTLGHSLWVHQLVKNEFGLA